MIINMFVFQNVIQVDLKKQDNVLIGIKRIRVSTIFLLYNKKWSVIKINT